MFLTRPPAEAREREREENHPVNREESRENMLEMLLMCIYIFISLCFIISLNLLVVQISIIIKLELMHSLCLYYCKQEPI